MSAFFTFIIVLILIFGLIWLLDKFVLSKVDKAKPFNRIIIGVLYSTFCGTVAATVSAALLVQGGTMRYWVINGTIYSLLLGVAITLMIEAVFAITSYNRGVSFLVIMIVMILASITIKYYIDISTVVSGQSFNKQETSQFYSKTMIAIIILIQGLYSKDYPKQITENKPLE